MRIANRLHIVGVNEQVGSFTWADAMVNSRCDSFASNTVNDALALWVHTPEPQTKLLPSRVLIHHPDFITALVFVVPLLGLLIMLGTEPALFEQHWAAGSVTCL